VLGRIPAFTARCSLPSWTQRAPQAVQKARRCGLTTMTIRTDWQIGQRDMVLLSPQLAPAEGRGGDLRHPCTRPPRPRNDEALPAYGDFCDLASSGPLSASARLDCY